MTTPITLHHGNASLPEFKTDVHGYYDIWLVVDTTPRDFHKLDCLLGDHDFGNSCNGIPQTLNLSWKLIRRDKAVQSETYDTDGFGFTQGVIKANLGSFDGIVGATQRLTVQINQDGEELNTAHPRIMVEAASGYWEKWIILRQLAILWAGIWLIVVFVMAVIAAIMRRSRVI